MKKYLVIDTETTGLFNWSLPADADGQPRMAQFGGIYLPDISGEPVNTAAHFIKPDGWEMSPEAGAVNGLTTEFLHENGVPVSVVLDSYEQAIAEGYVIVAFNAQFDTKVMRAELRRAGRPDLFQNTPNICVMRALKQIPDIPRKKGAKWSSLELACQYFGIDNAKAHDAMGDARAAMEILKILHGLDLLPPPEIHFAREKAPATPF